MMTEPLLVDAKTLAKMLSVSVRTVWTLNAAGELPKPVRLGGSTRWKLSEIKNWIDHQK
jgi:predicted DNA-binding transcriptional regulator AlpA